MAYVGGEINPLTLYIDRLALAQHGDNALVRRSMCMPEFPSSLVCTMDQT